MEQAKKPKLSKPIKKDDSELQEKCSFSVEKQTIDLEYPELVSVPLKNFEKPAHKLDIANAKGARSVAP